MVQINQNKRSCSPNQCWEKHTQDWKQFLLTSVTLKGPGITQAIHRSLENHCLNAQELVILAMSLNNSLPVTNRAFKSLKLVRLTPGNNFYYCCSRKIFKILLQKYSRIFSIRQDWKSRCLISGLKFFIQRGKKLSPRNRIKNQSIEMTKVRDTVTSKQDNQDSFTDVLCVCTKVKKGLSLIGTDEKDQHEMNVTSIWKDKGLSSTVIRLDARKCQSGRWQSGWNNQNETVRKKGNLNTDSPR